jgi:hypothetical protein
MTLHPSLKAVSYHDLHYQYGASNFQDTLADFIACCNHPGATKRQLQAHASNTLLPFSSLAVFHKIKFTSKLEGSSHSAEVIDAIHVQLEQTDIHGQIIPVRFDTVLVCGQCNTVHGKEGNLIIIWV